MTVLLLANDPRAFPTEAVLVSTPAREITLNDLEALTLELRDECEWGLGYEESLTKSGGGIGASGATVLELVLGIIGVVPTVAMLLDKLRRSTPDTPARDEAWEVATWAVAMSYSTVDRPSLHCKAEERHSDHWTFTLVTAQSNDVFEVDIYGALRSFPWVVAGRLNVQHAVLV